MKIDIRQCIEEEIMRLSRDELLDTTNAINRIGQKLREAFPQMNREQRRKAAAALVHKAQIKRSE